MTTKIDIRTYEPIEGSTAAKLAHLFDWAAKHYPKTPVSYQLAARAVLRLGRTPRFDGQEVALVQRAIHSITFTKVLADKYGRQKVRAAGGARATVDDNDQVEKAVAPRARRVEAAKRALAGMPELKLLTSAVAPTTIKATPIRVETLTPPPAHLLSLPAAARKAKGKAR